MLLKALKCEAQNLQIKLIWFWFISQFNSHPIWNTPCKKGDFNPLHPNISMQVLHTVLSTFPLVLTRRICKPIKSFLNLWSLILYSFNRNLLFRDDTVGRNKMLFSFREYIYMHENISFLKTKTCSNLNLVRCNKVWCLFKDLILSLLAL